MIFDDLNKKMVHFGQMGYKDFTFDNKNNKNNKHKQALYLARATKIKGNWLKNIYSPNYLSIMLLWS